MTRYGLVTIHHEGAGKPSNNRDLSHAGYTYAIGTGTFQRYRAVADSYATSHYNHVSCDVVLTGNRCDVPVTGQDVELIGRAVADSRSKGELIANVNVRPHCLSPGSATVCPCRYTLAVFPAIARACQGAIPHPQPSHPTHPTLAPGAAGGAVAELQHKLNVGCGYHLAVDGLYGPRTTEAVHAFQAFFHLAVDGICGPQTWSMVDYCYRARGGR